MSTLIWGRNLKASLTRSTISNCLNANLNMTNLASFDPEVVVHNVITGKKWENKRHAEGWYEDMGC